jgi:hypothetical protein
LYNNTDNYDGIKQMVVGPGIRSEIKIGDQGISTKNYQCFMAEPNRNIEVNGKYRKLRMVLGLNSS